MAWFAEFRALDRRLWSLAAARLVVTAGFSMVMPFLAIHLAIERKVPAIVVGIIWTIAGACGAAMQWLGGELADRVGRRPVMVGAMLLRALNLTALGYATAHESSIVVIGALIVANAMLRAFFDPVANALVADLAPASDRVAAYSLQRVGVNIGWAAGPAIAAAAHGWSYSTLFYLSAPVTLLATIGVATITAPALAGRVHAPNWHDLLAFRGDRPFVRFLLATVAFFILQAQLYQSLSIFAARELHLDRSQVGTIYTLNGLLVVFLQLPAVAWIRRVGTRSALVLGCLGYAASYASAGLAVGYLSILACVVAVTLSEIITSPAQQTSVAALAPPGRMGAYSGLYGLCQVIGQSAGPTIGTALLDGMPSRLAWLALAVFGVAAAWGYHAALKPIQVRNAEHQERSGVPT